MRSKEADEEIVILTASSAVRRMWLKVFSGGTNLPGEKLLGDCIPYVYPIPGNRRVVIAGPLIGAPGAVLAAEHFLKSGAAFVFMIGVAGGISGKNGDVRLGDLVFPRGALSEEGTSALFSRDALSEEEASGFQLSLERTIEAELSMGCCRRGKVWTTDAPSRQSPEKVERFASEGAVLVDMEYSALLTLSRVYGTGLAACFVVSDLVTGTRQKGFNSPEVLGGLERAVAGGARLVGQMMESGDRSTASGNSL